MAMISRLLLAMGIALPIVCVSALPAMACGGFFCMRQPIDQSAERILFVQDGPVLQAHVQIRYQGEAAKFSWVVPFPSEPKLGIGSDVLYDQMEQATAPQFRLDLIKTLGDCPQPPRRAYKEDRIRQKDGAAVQVVSRDLVGPYDTAVIRSNDPGALKKWLVANGFVIPPKLDPMLDPYVAGKYYFVALKLQQDRGSGDLQPIVVTYRATKPGIPIRLTAVAALPDMGVYTWVLGPARSVPENYRHVTINETQIDWLNGGANYARVVTRAVNEAGGQAFTTDYAGRSSKVDITPFLGQRFDLTGLSSLSDPVAFLRAIQSDGYFVSGSPTALAFVRRYVPVPKSMKDVWEPGFYSNPEQYRQQLQSAGVRVDARKAARELEETVVKPYRAIRRAFANHDYLTRLYTTMSPEEMTQDPTFRFNWTLPDVSNAHVASGVRDCRRVRNYDLAPIRVTLKNGVTFTIDPVKGQNEGARGSLPAALRIEQLKSEGPPSVIQDNRDRISRSFKQPFAESSRGEGETGLAVFMVGWWALRRRRRLPLQRDLDRQ